MCFVCSKNILKVCCVVTKANWNFCLLSLINSRSFGHQGQMTIVNHVDGP